MLEYDWLLTALTYGLIGSFIVPLKQAANSKSTPCIPVKFSFRFRFRFVAYTLCVVVSGSEEIPVQSRNCNGITITCFQMLEYDWLLTALTYGLIGCFIVPLKQVANFKPTPCIPVKFSFRFRFRFVAFTLCVVVSGSEEVPVQSRNFNGITITCFQMLEYDCLLTVLIYGLIG